MDNFACNECFALALPPDLLMSVCAFFKDNEVNISELSADNYFEGERHAILVKSAAFSAECRGSQMPRSTK